MKTRIFWMIMLIALLPAFIVLLLTQIAAVRTMDIFWEKSLMNRAVIVNNNIDIIPQMAAIPLQEAARKDIFKEFLGFENNDGALAPLAIEEEARNQMDTDEIHNLFIVDQAGEVVLSQTPGEEGLILSNTKPYQNIMAGAEINAEITIDNDGVKTLRVSLPIKDEDDSILGIINGNVDTKKLIRTMKNMCGDECQEIYLIGSDAVLSSKEWKRSNANYDVPSDFKGKCELYDLIVDFRAGKLKDNQGVITYDVQGKQMVGAFITLQNAEAIMVFAQDKESIYKEAKELGIMTNAAYMVVVLLVMIYAFFTAFKWHRPVRKLHLHTKALAEGGRAKPCTDLGHEEYEEICKNINHIADNLKKSEEERTLSLKRDGLTGIPTFKAFCENLDTLWGNDEKQAVLTMAFDGFEAINQSVGYQIGDRVFEELGYLFRSLPENICHSARLAGGHFLVFMSGWEAGQAPGDMAEKIIQGVRELQFIDDTKVNIEVSIGVRYIMREEKGDFKTAMEESHYAMKKGREMGKNIYVVYHGESLHNINI